MDVSNESVLSGSDEKEVYDGLEFPEEVEEALKEVGLIVLFNFLIVFTIIFLSLLIFQKYLFDKITCKIILWNLSNVFSKSIRRVIHESKFEFEC